jgi:hypothetical protein
MIRLTLTEQQLFDVILAVYATKAGDPGEKATTNAQSEAQRRREDLLTKLHDAFDRNQTPAVSGGGRTLNASVGARSARAAS